MSTHKDEKNGTWYVMVRYHDWKGVKRQKCKRGFATRREAQEWERNFQLQTDGDPDMTFEAFLELYEHDIRPRLKENTWLSKEHMIRTKLFPTFGKKMLSEIETRDIIAWQNELLAYRDEKKQPYSPTYLKSIHNQLVAILNHAVRHYGLKSNPASKVGYIGSKEAEEMQFWTKEEYQRFAEAVMDKPMSYYAFEMLYWCGIREGELLALTPGDFDFKAGTVSISKSYQRLHGEDVITTPKTKKSVRTIRMPKFLCEEMQEYIKSLYGVKKKDPEWHLGQASGRCRRARSSHAGAVDPADGDAGRNHRKPEGGRPDGMDPQDEQHPQQSGRNRKGSDHQHPVSKGNRSWKKQNETFTTALKCRLRRMPPSDRK